ncbi:cold shock domain-containing E1 isoform X3 [Brachionus plicatilis]|uniref:Cold shock domain-containing E1 isoform X3 n=1 Tax=Brachionus plicatilis TaxID=10195 RepID=A0A3M7RHZ1_BRAPC|nr:cold shock domain-containing E1 isoform X3 [Brachionus plicatilis]
MLTTFVCCPGMQTKSPLPGLLKGKIVQVLRSHNQVSEQSGEYYGKIQVISESGKKEPSYQYGLFSLADRKISLRIGDIVSFQLIEGPDGSKKAFNVLVIQSSSTDQVERTEKQPRSKELKKGKIDSLKGHCGYIEYSSGSDLKIDFMDSKNVEIADVKAGDEVEFQISNRNGKLSATKIKKVGSSSTVVNKTDNQNEQRPGRLLNKLKSSNIDNQSGKQFIIIRGPINPDGKSKSFSKKFIERVPGAIPSDFSANQ